MSILIKGMEMPENCCQCIHTAWNGRDDVCRFSGISALSIGRQSDCPLIEVSEDVQPVKHGRWISIGHKLSRICSVCDCDEPYKFADDDANVYDYCPHCGAKMDGEI